MHGPRVIVCAYGGFGCAGIDALVHAGAHIVHGFSHADQPGENIWWPSVMARCQSLGAPCDLDADFSATGPGSAAHTIHALHADFIFSFYYRRMIPERILDLTRYGGYNLHGSLLPKYRGRAPINWQLVHGETRSGLTLHRMVRQADAGDIVAQTAIDVGPDTDAFALTCQLMALTPAFLEPCLPALLAGRAMLTVQDHSQATLYRGRRPEDGLIDWSAPARRIHDLVRAVAPPWPGAFTALGGGRVSIDRTRVVEEQGQAGPPGLILPNGRVACGAGVVEVLMACDAQRQRMELGPGWTFASPSAPTPVLRSLR